MAAQFHLADLFETVAATVPDRLAIVSDSARLTYAELNARCDRIAGGLASHGIGRGDTVGLYLMNGPAYLESFIAAVKLGAVPFNVNYRYRAEELRYLFNNAGAAAVIHDAEFAPVMDDVRGLVPSLRLSVSVGGDAAGSIAYADLLAAEPAARAERSEDDILLLYTGGTTGMPKGVMWPHKAFFFACAGGGGFFNPNGACVAPGDIADRVAHAYPLRLMPIAPLMHGAAIWSAWSALSGGITIVLDEGRVFDPERLWDTIAREQVSMISIVGDAMAIPLRDALRANPGRWDLASVVNLGSGGAVFSRHVKDDFRALLPAGASIIDGMGSSETGISGMAEPSADGMMRLRASDVQAVVLDDRLALPGETGLVARSGHIPVGYFGDAAKTAETFRTIGGRLWAISGDSARAEADGTITVFGRGSTSINSGGEKIFPEEIEEALRAHPAVLDAVVAGAPDPRWGESVCAIVSLRPGAEAPGLPTIRAFLRERLAGYKLPRSLIVVDEVPRSAAGKQDTRWAQRQAASVAASQVEPA